MAVPGLSSRVSPNTNTRLLSRTAASFLGFNLVELLTVTSILSVLFALLFPALSSAAERGRQTACLNNLRQLSLAWQLYSDDHGKLALNGFINANGNDKTPYWVQGYLNHGASPDATNTALLNDSRFALFAPYIPTVQSYRCPSDRKLFELFRTPHSAFRASKVRSYSLNGFLGWNFAVGSSPPGRVALKESQIPRPQDRLTFADLRADSICWPFFGINGDESFFMYPAAYHGRAGMLSFADGHTERHRWTDPRTYNPARIDWHSHNQDSRRNPDLTYLQRHATDQFGFEP